jgi:hypothetical protein
LNEKKSDKDKYSDLIEKELDDVVRKDDIYMSIVIDVVGVLLVLFFIAHQVWSTGFFTEKFSLLEMFLLYGSIFYWIFTCAILLLGFKNPSRDLDSFGGLIFVTVTFAWLLIVFPFEFAHVADVLPDFLRFLIQWISNEIARVLMVIGFLFHLFLSFYAAKIRLMVLKARASRTDKLELTEDEITKTE